MIRPARLLLPFAAVLMAYVALPALADTLPVTAETLHRESLLPIDEVVVPPPAPDLTQRIGSAAFAAYDALPAMDTVTGAAAGALDGARGTLSDWWSGARETLRPATDRVEAIAAPAIDAAAPAIAAAGTHADRAIAGAEALAVDARLEVERLAGAFHESAAELRHHPVVEAAADVGLLLRVVEAVGVSAVVGGLAWRKIRGA